MLSKYNCILSPSSPTLIRNQHVPSSPSTTPMTGRTPRIPKSSQFQCIFDRAAPISAELVRHPHILLTLAESLRSGYLTDVMFKFGPGENAEKIHAHKLILSMASPVFDTMFNGSLPEEKEITISDVSPMAFKVLLQYLYTNQYPIWEEAECSSEHLINVLNAARKYDIPELEKLASSQLQDLITLDNVIPILEASLLYDQSSLQQKCWHCLEYYTDQFFDSDTFLSIREPILQLILQRDCLSISEIQLFYNVERWGRSECLRQSLDPEKPSDLRKVLEPGILNLIRFPTMKPQEFADGPATSGILTDGEVSGILLYICSSLKTTPPSSYNPVPRRWRNPSIYAECLCIDLRKNVAPRTCNFCQVFGDNDSARTGSGREDKNGGILLTPCTPPRYCPCKTRDYCPHQSKRLFGPR